MAGTLFSKAKKETKTTSKKSSHPRLRPSGMDQDELFETIQEFEELQTKIKRLSAREGIVKDILKELATDTWTDLYNEDKKNPGTVVIEAEQEGDIAQFMYVATDRFVTVRTEEQADEIEEKFGEGIIERNTTYSFDSKMLEKYGEAISNLIENSDEIAEGDKEKLFISSDSFRIKSGTIDTLDNLGDVKEVSEGLKMVSALKNPQVIKS